MSLTTYKYQTIAEAVNELIKRGYAVDFNLDKNLEAFSQGTYDAADFEIVEVHRYEGESDPGDEAVVYAIESGSGIKGILVAGYGMSSGRRVQELIASLRIRQE
jgi:hypothetical protein